MACYTILVPVLFSSCLTLGPKLWITCTPISNPGIHHTIKGHGKGHTICVMDVEGTGVHEHLANIVRIFIIVLCSNCILVCDYSHHPWPPPLCSNPVSPLLPGIPVIAYEILVKGSLTEGDSNLPELLCPCPDCCLQALPLATWRKTAPAVVGDGLEVFTYC